jgi:hypothetical protein
MLRPPFQRFERRRFGFDGPIFRVMRVVTMGAKEVSPPPWTGKKTGPFPMDACLPVFVNVAMTFATEPVALCEADKLPVVKPQFVAIPCIVAIKAPSHRLRMMEPDIGMFILQFPLFSVYLQGGMAIAARKHTLCHRRRGDGKFLTCTTYNGDEIDP